MTTTVSNLSGASLQRLRCARQHPWSDDVWRAKTRTDGIKVYESTVHCTRRGCNRTRTEQISQRTYDRIGQPQYKGEQQKLGRVDRTELIYETIARQ